jgi:serine/threonine-protein kinase
MMSAIPIKIECGCGQRYEFEVVPVAGKMPGRISCPSCGADGTAVANLVIAEATPVRSPATGGRRGMGALGRRPLMDDDTTREFIEAKHDIQRAGSIAMVAAGLSLTFSLLRLAGVKIFDTDAWLMVDAAVVCGLACGVYQRSRTCAMLLACYFLASFVLAWGQFGLVGVVVRAIVFYYIARGAQAAFTFHKLSRRLQVAV